MTRREHVDEVIEAGRAEGRYCVDSDLATSGAVTRQAFLQRALTLILGSAAGSALVASCGGDGSGMGKGMMDGGGMPDWMMSRGGMDPQMRQHMRVTPVAPSSSIARSATCSTSPSSSSMRSNSRRRPTESG